MTQSKCVAGRAEGESGEGGEGDASNWEGCEQGVELQPSGRRGRCFSGSEPSRFYSKTVSRVNRLMQLLLQLMRDS